MAGKHADLLINRSYMVIHYSKQKLRHSSSCGTFKMPCMKFSKSGIQNSKVFESKRKCERRKLEAKSNKRRMSGHFRAYKKKRTFIKVMSKNKYKGTSKKSRKYENRWERKIGLVVNRRKIKVENSVSSLTPRHVTMAHQKDIQLASKEWNYCSKANKDLVHNIPSMFRQHSGINSLERLAANQDTLPSTKQSGKSVWESSRNSSEKPTAKLLMKQPMNIKKLHHVTKEDYVDDLFNVLGV
jgi:hypothetical protein